MKNMIILILVGILLGCSSKQHSYTDVQVEQFQLQFQKHVIEKNEYYKNGEHSPILEEDKTKFTGLHFYQYDPNYRFEGPISKYEEPETVIIYGTKKDDERPSLKYGHFDFAWNNQKYQLQIYKIIRKDTTYQHYLFLGFTDETSNKETYGGGRYIDLEENEDNFYIVDFNYAYNPYCAYNPKYSCAIPPKENHLKIAIEAGEKKWHE
ncbi:DUF1684 domain-containing protein [Calditrichota bacterium]